MLFRVAALLGMTIEQLRREMWADEFQDWCTFYDLEPWGFEAQRINAGTVAAEVANMAGRRRRSADAKPSDYLPKVAGQTKRKQSAREMKAALARSGRRNNG